ncbi:MAG: hypothetical protein WB507_14685 [Solirubrobacterales bacterium]
MRPGPIQHPTRLGFFLAVTLVIAAALGSTALAVPVITGNLEVGIEGRISPTKLSKRIPTPIILKLKGSIQTTDGSQVPALKTLNLQFDKHGTIYTKGLATCSVAKLRSTTTSAARAACRPSLIGHGRATAEIYFPEQRPFSAQGPMLIFNGKPMGRKPVLIIHVYADVPAPTTFVTTGVIGKGHGKYGTATQIHIPTIVGGQGSLTGFEATLGRTWRYRGHRESLLHATCPTGSLFAKGEFDFVNGDRISGEIAKRCRGGRGKR